MPNAHSFSWEAIPWAVPIRERGGPRPWPVGKHASLFVTVDNLFNRRYEVLAGYRMPGTNAAGGIDLRF